MPFRVKMVSIPEGAIEGCPPALAKFYHYEFQYPKVRLKAFCASAHCRLSSVSIPEGAIEGARR